ncbi:MAG: tRNA (guanine(46)-N(7))-methyltransferase TrmB [Pseudomonadota bacterium]
MTDEHRNFYGRIKGKTLKPKQVQDLETLLPNLAIAGVTVADNPDRSLLDIQGLAAGRPVWLEIGFGGGEHLVHQAKLNPDVCFVGVEPYVNGMAMLLGKLRRENVSNVRLHLGDARDLMDVLPAGSIDKAFLLYPDPWPKTRHHRRRFVTREHLDPLARCLRPGAEFRVASDIADYIRQTLEQVPKAGFDWQANGPTDWRDPWADWLSTRYEQKAIREGRPQHYLTFHKR